jgi:hypothetical protein
MSLSTAFKLPSCFSCSFVHKLWAHGIPRSSQCLIIHHLSSVFILLLFSSTKMTYVIVLVLAITFSLFSFFRSCLLVGKSLSFLANFLNPSMLPYSYFLLLISSSLHHHPLSIHNSRSLAPEYNFLSFCTLLNWPSTSPPLSN